MAALVYFASSLLVRPTELGESLTIVGLGLAATSAVLSILSRAREPQFLLRKGSLVGAVGLEVVLWLFLGVQGLLTLPVGMADLLKALVANLIYVTSAYIVFQDRRAARRFALLWGTLLLISATSYLLTMTLLLILRVPPESLAVAHIPIPTYPTSGDVLLPITPVFRNYLLNGHVPRLLAWLREPGIAQAIFVWSAGLYWHESHARPSFRVAATISLLLGALMTFSTASIASIGVFVGATAFLGTTFPRSRPEFVKTILRSLALIPFVTLVALSILLAPVFGLGRKIHLHSPSVTDRLHAMQVALSNVPSNFWGVGLYGIRGSNAGINLIGELAQIGVIGGMLVLLPYFWVFLRSRPRKLAIATLGPILLTSIVSQPLLDAPLIYAILLCTARLLGPDRGGRLTGFKANQQRTGRAKCDPVGALPSGDGAALPEAQAPHSTGRPTGTSN